ncbi:hypothetical protein KWH29_14575 [Xanthomonas campestris pv. paulliniae]|nr:hypothetical protein [Xanthomonas campestris pv. paulliniae]
MKLLVMRRIGSGKGLATHHRRGKSRQYFALAKTVVETAGGLGQTASCRFALRDVTDSPPSRLDIAKHHMDSPSA